MVFHGPAKKVHLLYQNSKTGAAGEMDFTYFNAVYTCLLYTSSTRSWA